MNAPLPDPIIDSILGHLATEREFVFLETSKTTAEERHSLLFTKPVTRLDFTAGQGPEAFLATAQAYLDQGYFLAGWFAYEFGYALEPVLRPLLAGLGDTPLARLGVYREPRIFDQAAPAPEAPDLPGGAPLGPYAIANLTPSQGQAEYVAALARIKEYIAAGDTYQVNYTVKLLFDFTGSPESLYLALRRNQLVSYGAYLNLGGQPILSFSPELFFRKTQSHCLVRPMKGTIARGRTVAEDRQRAAALRDDPKNRSENVMIVDLLRNDLGRLSRLGGVETTSLFTVETYATLHQMTSSISGRLDDHVGLAALFTALFPCGSVTGAPKIRTMEIIHELERQPRGVYTGGIGYLAPNGEAVFSVPIRTVVLANGHGEMGIGSGVVFDSDPEAEWQECLLKGRFLSHPRPDFQLIETILWQRATGFWLLDRHLARLATSADYFDYPLDQETLRRQLDTAAANWQDEAVKVRLLLAMDGRLTIEASPCPALVHLDLPLATAQADETLPRVTFSPQPTDSRQPFLFHKTTCRDLYNRERQEAIDHGYHEVLFCNERGEVTEGSISNLLIRQGEAFYTPPVSCGLLAGTFRQYLLDRHPELIREKVITPSEVRAADAVYLINSVRGLIQVGL